MFVFSVMWSQYNQKAQHPSHPSHPLHKHITYFYTIRLKHYLHHVSCTTNIPTDPHTVTTTCINNTSMRHIHTSLVSRHLTTIGNNKTLRTPPQHISNSERYFPASLVAPLPSLDLINPPFSNHPYTKSTRNRIHHHYTRWYTQIHNTHHLFKCTHIVTPGFVDRLRRRD